MLIIIRNIKINIFPVSLKCNKRIIGKKIFEIVKVVSIYWLDISSFVRKTVLKVSKCILQRQIFLALLHKTDEYHFSFVVSVIRKMLCIMVIISSEEVRWTPSLGLFTNFHVGNNYCEITLIQCMIIYKTPRVIIFQRLYVKLNYRYLKLHGTYDFGFCQALIYFWYSYF